MKLKRWFADLKVKQKLSYSFLLVGIIALMVIIIGVYSLSTMDDQYSDMYEQHGEGIAYFGNIGLAFNQSYASTILMISDYMVATEALNNIEINNEKIKSELIEYKKQTQQHNELLVGFEADLDQFFAYQEEISGLLESSKYFEAYKILYGGLRDTSDSINDTIEEIMNYNIESANSEMTRLSDTADTLRLIIILLTAVYILIALYLVKVLTGAVADRIRAITNITEKITLGDIDVTINEELMTNDEIGILAKANNKMVDSIRNQSFVARRVASGDLTARCDVRSDNDILSISINTVVDQLSRLVFEIRKIGKATGEGKLDVRGESTQFMGEYKTIVEELNTAIDNIKEPIMYASEILEIIAAGEEVPPITKEYKGDYNVAIESLKEVNKSLDELFNQINKLLEATEEGNTRVRADSSNVSGNYKSMVDGLNGILEKTTTPIIEASKVLGKMSKGDLTVRVTGEHKGDFAIIKHSLNFVLDRFNEVLGEINIAAEQVTSGARQISDSSILLSEGTTEQASSIEELTASTEEIFSQTRKNADNATEANRIAKVSNENAKESSQRLEELVEAIDEINTSSNNISAIIKVIEDIAFQTNILALNAAVEAARAGQYGKGFAVVADEVKNLAQKSADAAKETTKMIQDSISKSENGKKLVDETVHRLEALFENTDKIANLVDEITKASQDQAIGIEQINRGIMQVSDVVQTTSATSEESAAASEELASQAEVLRDNVRHFKLVGSEDTEDYEDIEDEDEVATSEEKTDVSETELTDVKEEVKETASKEQVSKEKASKDKTAEVKKSKETLVKEETKKVVSDKKASVEDKKEAKEGAKDNLSKEKAPKEKVSKKEEHGKKPVKEEPKKKTSDKKVTIDLDDKDLGKYKWN